MSTENENVRVLFVDDEPNILEGLRRSLRPLRRAWEMVFVGSGRDALEALGQRPFDAIVSDMRMPEMDGLQLLDEVLRRHPHVIRIVLSGYSDWELIMRPVGVTHQYLTKPCPPHHLCAVIDQALELRALLQEEPSLTPLIGRIETLPARPALYLDVAEALSAPEVTPADIAEVLSSDRALVSQVLQSVSSPAFGLHQPVTELEPAIRLIGLDRIGGLVLWVAVLTKLAERASACLNVSRLLDHGLLVGELAGRLAAAEKTAQETVNDSFTAGLLHDIGELVLAAELGADYARVRALARRESCELYRVEELEFGATHAELGAYLLSAWGLSKPIVEAVVFHHEPREASGLHDGFSPITAVHVANALVQQHFPEQACALPDEPDVGYLSDQGYAVNLANWRELAERFFSILPA